jgi:hypothetical protein
MNDLFPADVDLGQHRVVNGGCTDPIGKVPGRSRRRGYRAPARSTTLNVLVDIRRLLSSDLALRHGQTQIRQGQYNQASLLSETQDLLRNVLGRLSRLERAAGLVEQPQAPKPTRNRRFD